MDGNSFKFKTIKTYYIPKKFLTGYKIGKTIIKHSGESRKIKS